LDHTSFEGKQLDIFAMSVENTARIQQQNDREISVIIGNPPYNAKQENFNQNNANRSYLSVDQSIKDTYIRYGKAQNKNVVYDMYTRFIRWASDRLSKDGIIAFITNSSFLDARAFDGFRKCIQDDFAYAYFIDLGGNVRTISGKDGIFICEKHTIFGTAAMTGIAILFLVKDSHSRGSKIFYTHPFHIHELRDNKLDYLRQNKFSSIQFEHILPDNKYNWINQVDNDFEQLVPLVDKDVKAGKSEQAVFKVFSSGIKTQRDEWVYDFSRDTLEAKVRYMIGVYQKTLKDVDFPERYTIKWDADLTKYLERKIVKEFNQDNILLSVYRPYIKEYLYFDKHFNGRTYQWFEIHNINKPNKYIAFVALGCSKPFHCLATDCIIDLHLTGDSQCLPLYYYDKEGNQQENITNWGLEQFRQHYQNPNISKEEIFHYTYAVLHNPSYRQKYEQNLKRDFPRLPYYDNFSTWVNWGKQLLNLHLNYETVAPYPLKRIDIPLERNPKPKLKANKTTHQILLDEITTLSEIPPLAWEYKLGNRSALEWILDQYKETKPKDKFIAENFPPYRFADYKEKVIDLLHKVCRVSVETMEIIKSMETGSSS
jgi:predicted helicase